MPRPKSLENIPLVPGTIHINTYEFQAGFKGIIDDKGRVPTVGIEFVGTEAYIFVKKR